MHLELSRPKPRIYYDGDNPILMSLTEMRHLASFREEPYESVNSCVSDYYGVAESRKTDVVAKSLVVVLLVKHRD